MRRRIVVEDKYKDRVQNLEVYVRPCNPNQPDGGHANIFINGEVVMHIYPEYYMIKRDKMRTLGFHEEHVR